MGRMNLSVGEVAQCLDLPSSTIERWIRQGRIPIHKSGGECVFDVSRLRKWAAKHNLTFTPERGGKPEEEKSGMDGLLPALKRGGVFYELAGQDAEDVLRSAVEVIPQNVATDRGELLNRLIEREQLTSTGIGKGVAIPHPRTPLEEGAPLPAICTCFLEEEVVYGAVDDKPVFILFLLISPDVKLHLHLLSRLAYCLRNDDFIAFLKGRPESGALFQKIGELEKQLDSAEKG